MQIRNDQNIKRYYTWMTKHQKYVSMQQRCCDTKRGTLRLICHPLSKSPTFYDKNVTI